ncbi:tetratricopeptide repeat protein [Paenibacillus sp. SC116]|uniref:tetratricopeptide repeat protein n=1 Tax=Paenibacillus sp. SC116 TaxID=2968986 RepID=UPI00215B0792|nr:tetratricopeptide repeat protein [Paenibacillus sp. SC116]MCR8843414.1 tetratricopeptide repeat protein [Paenibacillus sp. SC116]
MDSSIKQPAWDSELKRAVQMRQESQLEASLQLLLKLASNFPDEGIVQYQCAWAHDALGKEISAVPYYVRALSSELTNEDRRGAYLGLGSTYRAIGEYGKSKALLEEAIARFPDAREFKVFYALTLYNLGHHEESTSLLLRQLVETTQDADISQYNRALLFYADHLNEVWTDEE